VPLDITREGFVPEHLLKFEIMSRRTEQDLFQQIRPLAERFGRVRVLDTIEVIDQELPIWGLVIGPDDRTLPTFGLFGGVHGLERVGSHVVLHHLKSLLHQMTWDENLRELFQKVRLVSIPMVNPGGLFLSRRSNPNGVDVMRNAPVESDERGYRLVSGQKISPRIPWYRGNPEKPERETKALINFVDEEILASRFGVALDVHSGFGLRDRLWYPFSHTRKTFPYQETVNRFNDLLETSLPHHVYKVEKQTESYLIHGGPWDFFFLRHLANKKDGQFIPWCLEMGSWSWLRKNPLQIFSKPGLFNPILPHRYSRIMRRHRGLLDLFLRSTLNYKIWSKQWQNGSPFVASAAKVDIG